MSPQQVEFAQGQPQMTDLQIKAYQVRTILDTAPNSPHAAASVAQILQMCRAQGQRMEAFSVLDRAYAASTAFVWTPAVVAAAVGLLCDENRVPDALNFLKSRPTREVSGECFEPIIVAMCTQNMVNDLKQVLMYAKTISKRLTAGAYEAMLVMYANSRAFDEAENALLGLHVQAKVERLEDSTVELVRFAFPHETADVDFKNSDHCPRCGIEVYIQSDETASMQFFRKDGKRVWHVPYGRTVNGKLSVGWVCCAPPPPEPKPETLMQKAPVEQQKIISQEKPKQPYSQQTNDAVAQQAQQQVNPAANYAAQQQQQQAMMDPAQAVQAYAQAQIAYQAAYASHSQAPQDPGLMHTLQAAYAHAQTTYTILQQIQSTLDPVTAAAYAAQAQAAYAHAQSKAAQDPAFAQYFQQQKQ